MKEMFSRLAPYIQDYIYASKWTELGYPDCGMPGDF